MKKIFLSLSTALVVTLSLVGCGKTEPTPADKPSTTEYVTTESEKPSTDSDKPSGNSEIVTETETSSTTEDEKPSTDSDKPSGDSEIVTETETSSTTESGHASTVNPSEPEPVHVDTFLNGYGELFYHFLDYTPVPFDMNVLHYDELYNGSHCEYLPYVMLGTSDSETRLAIPNYDETTRSIYMSYVEQITMYTSTGSLLDNQLIAIFDEAYYADTYPEAATFCNDNNYSLYWYFKLYGMLEGHKPNADFDLNTYNINFKIKIHSFYQIIMHSFYHQIASLSPYKIFWRRYDFPLIVTTVA